MGKPSDKNHSAENVRVVCRCRPVNDIERSRGGAEVAVKFSENDPGLIEVNVEDSQSKHNFDRCFGMESTQQEVYEDSVLPLIDDVLNGYNATVFAYGQTGTGKTHTMEGVLHDEQLRGVIPRSVSSLFDGVANADDNLEFTIKVSYVEIYMEKIRDLLDDTHVKNNLTVREDKVNGIYIAGVTEEYVTSQDELLSLMQHGARNRATAATGMNEGSSRSHSVFTITINQRNLVNASNKSGKLVLVDLAGSEMVKKTSASGQQLEEAKTINKSLSALGQVINALTDPKISHIPYRDSKLTRVLQDSLGGNSKTVLVIAISPSVYNGPETLSTIRFGSRAKSITNKVTVNATRSVDELEALLARAEKAIDMQSALIANLQNQIAGGAGARTEDDDASGSGGDSGSEDGGDVQVKPAPDGGKSGDNSAVVAQLQADIAHLHAELEDEKADNERIGTELKEMTIILRDKERLLGEAGELLQEARRHYESQRERCDVLVREKSEVASQLESTKTQVGEDLEKAKFDLQEARNSIETLTADNERMRREIEEMSGDSAPGAREGGGSAPPPRPPPKDSEFASPDSNKHHSSSSRRQSTLGATDSGLTPQALSIIASPLPSASTRQSEQESALKSFAALIDKHEIASKASNGAASAISAFFAENCRALEDVIGSHEARSDALEKLAAASNKRVKDIEAQRERLTADLKSRTESAVALKLEVENLLSAASAIKAQSGGSDEVAAAVAASEAIREKQEANNKSLQQRLEQLVAVHRQLLRKYATLELDAGEQKKKINLRDERIKQLESNHRGNSATMRQQAERHVAELSNLREQIALMRAEHLQRMEQQAHDQHHSHRHHHKGPPRALRGGASSAGVEEQNSKFRSMRGGGGATSGAGSVFGAASSGDVMTSPSSGPGGNQPSSPVVSSGFAALGDMLSRLGTQ